MSPILGIVVLNKIRWKRVAVCAVTHIAVGAAENIDAKRCTQGPDDVPEAHAASPDHPARIHIDRERFTMIAHPTTIRYAT